jgi:hypothetical protein
VHGAAHLKEEINERVDALECGVVYARVGDAVGVSDRIYFDTASLALCACA